jgi:hypothetical protein
MSKARAKGAKDRESQHLCTENAKVEDAARVGEQTTFVAAPRRTMLRQN